MAAVAELVEAIHSLVKINSGTLHEVVLID